MSFGNICIKTVIQKMRKLEIKNKSISSSKMKEMKIFFYQIISQIYMLYVTLMGVTTHIICPKENNDVHTEQLELKQSEYNTNISCLVCLSLMNAPCKQL